MTEREKKELLQDKRSIIKRMTIEFEHWEYIKDHGCNDPFYADGVNMNLIRNHIIYDKCQLLEICEKLNEPVPEEYYIQTPPKVDNNYMCKDGPMFEVRRQRVEAWGQKIVTKLSRKFRLSGQTELF